MEEQAHGIWSWIKRHAGLIVAAVVGVVAFLYLFILRRPSGSAPGLTAISQPPPVGGGGGGGPAPETGPPSGLPLNIHLPYSPDFSVLTAITDAALRELYEREYNLETQINQATLEGNTALVNTLSTALAGVQDQIAHYQPATPKPESQPPPSPTLTGEQLGRWREQYFTQTYTNPLTAFSSWIAALRNAAPDVANRLSLDQWRAVFNQINQSVAFNPSSPWRNDQSVLNMLNSIVQSPSSVVGTSDVYYYTGSRVLAWINGRLTDVTSQFAPTTTTTTTSTPPAGGGVR